MSLIINRFISKVPTITLYFHIPPTVKRNTKDPLLLARHSWPCETITSSLWKEKKLLKITFEVFQGYHEACCWYILTAQNIQNFHLFLLPCLVWHHFHYTLRCLWAFRSLSWATEPLFREDTESLTIQRQMKLYSAYAGGFHIVTNSWMCLALQNFCIVFAFEQNYSPNKPLKFISFHSCPETSSRRFAATLQQSLQVWFLTSVHNF